MEIRRVTNADHEAIWEIFRSVIAGGDTYAFDPAMPRDEALAYWCAEGASTYVAVEDGEILGTYILKPNQPGLGSHVANAGYMVSEKARGRGIGSPCASTRWKKPGHKAISPCSSTSW